MENVPNECNPPLKHGNPFKKRFRFSRDLIPQLNYNYYSSHQYYPWYPQHNIVRNNRGKSIIGRSNTGRTITGKNSIGRNLIENVYKRVNRSGKKACFIKKQKAAKQPSRPSSPLLGTEEYRLRKIQQTSELIKKQLLSGDIEASNKDDSPEIEESAINIGVPRKSNYCQEALPNMVSEKLSSKKMLKDKVQDDKVSSKQKSVSRNWKKANQTSYNVEEIHDKIVNHISNLNFGRKVNLINSASSGYDLAIQQIQKQKRLELSRALRAMCTAESVESAEVVNSLIPDIGIRLEDLPREVIEQLSITLNSVSDEQQLLGELFGLGDASTSLEQVPESLQEESAASSIFDVKMKFADNETSTQIQSSQEEKSGTFEVKIELADNEIKSIQGKKDLHSEITCDSKAIIPDSLVDFCPFDNDNCKTENNDMYEQDCVIIEPKHEIIDIEEDKFDPSNSEILLAQPEVKEELSIEETVIHRPGIVVTTNVRKPVSLPPPKPVRFIEKGIQKNFECDTYCTKSTQTLSYNNNPVDLNEAVSIMLEIDLEVERLTKIRRDIFLNLSKQNFEGKYSPLQYESHIRLRSPAFGGFDLTNPTHLGAMSEKRSLWSSQVSDSQILQRQSSDGTLIPTSPSQKYVEKNSTHVNKRKDCDRVNEDNPNQNIHVDEDNRILKRRKSDDVQLVLPAGMNIKGK